MLLTKLPNGKPEIYSAVQGEGVSLGVPVVFVRLAGCNQQCKFCDTAYSWGKNISTTKLTPEQVADRIRKAVGKCKAVVFTGGEPLLQQQEIIQVLRYLPHWRVEIETNGTIKMCNELKYLIDQVNCSPKLSSSGNKFNPKSEVARDFVAWWLTGNIFQRSPVLIFKFVVTNDKRDLKEIDQYVKTNGINKPFVYLMPEGVTREDILTGTEKLVKVCQKTGYNLTTRLHILLYGKKRAV